MMRSRSQKVLAVAFLATALCADRAITAAPTFRQETTAGTFAGRLVTRLTVGLRRVVPSTRVYQSRREEAAGEEAVIAPAPVAALPQLLSPFEFRLPPPLA
jgi:hypothetical protein